MPLGMVRWAPAVENMLPGCYKKPSDVYVESSLLDSRFECCIRFEPFKYGLKVEKNWC